MKEALGLVETRGLSTAILVADSMIKTANIKIIDIENTRGAGYMAIKISGDVGAVNAAVECGRQIALKYNSFVSAKVIPRPSNNIEVAFCQPKKDDISRENTINEKDNGDGAVKETEISPSSEVKQAEISDNPTKEKESVSSPEKSKPKKSGRKKAEPKKDE